jgi:hypothetical protein
MLKSPEAMNPIPAMRAIAIIALPSTSIILEMGFK